MPAAPAIRRCELIFIEFPSVWVSGAMKKLRIDVFRNYFFRVNRVIRLESQTHELQSGTATLSAEGSDPDMEFRLLGDDLANSFRSSGLPNPLGELRLDGPVPGHHGRLEVQTFCG